MCQISLFLICFHTHSIAIDWFNQLVLMDLLVNSFSQHFELADGLAGKLLEVWAFVFMWQVIKESYFMKADVWCFRYKLWWQIKMADEAGLMNIVQQTPIVLGHKRLHQSYQIRQHCPQGLCNAQVESCMSFFLQIVAKPIQEHILNWSCWTASESILFELF